VAAHFAVHVGVPGARIEPGVSLLFVKLLIGKGAQCLEHKGTGRGLNLFAADGWCDEFMRKGRGKKKVTAKSPVRVFPLVRGALLELSRMGRWARAVQHQPADEAVFPSGAARSAQRITRIVIGLDFWGCVGFGSSSRRIMVEVRINTNQFGILETGMTFLFPNYLGCSRSCKCASRGHTAMAEPLHRSGRLTEGG